MKNRKELGQHWLKDRDVLEAIAEMARPEEELSTLEPARPPVFTGDSLTLAGSARGACSRLGRSLPLKNKPLVCLEIGPGLGTLTSSLLRRFDGVVAVEYDERLARNLPKSFPGKNLEVVHEDILKFDLEKVPAPYVVAGNIPYYITSPIIFKLLGAENRPERIVLLIQKEVAERILAEKGAHTHLSVSVQALAEVEAGFVVPREYFAPPPKVDSAVITLNPRKEPLLTPEELKFVKMGFSNPRKKLIKNLPFEREELEETFLRLGISENARAADLGHEEWRELTRAIHKI